MKKFVRLEYEEAVSLEIVPDIGPDAEDCIMVQVGAEYVFFPLDGIQIGEFVDDERSAADQRATVCAKLRAIADRIERGEP